MLSLNDFIAAYTGKTVSFPNCSDNECMTLLHVYLQEVFGLTDPLLLANPSAYEVYTNFAQEAGNQYFTLIANTPEGVPNPGDIVVFAANNPEAQTEANGHVCIFISGDVNSFTSFDCNYPTGSLPHVQRHTYGGVLGWLSPKAQGEFVTEAEMTKLVQESMAFESFITAGYNSPNDVNTKLQSYTDQVTALQNQVGKLTSSNEALQLEVQSNKDQMAKLADITQQQATSDSSAIDQGLTASNQVKELTSDLVSIASDLDTTYPPVKNITGAIQTLQTQLKAAQIALTKQAEINKALKESQLRTQAVVNTTKGFFSKVISWVWVSKS